MSAPGAPPIVPSAFTSFRDEFTQQGKRPVVFDVLGPDRATSILPPELKLVLHVNPQTMKFNYTKLVTRIQTRGGYVEQHWGDAVEDVSFTMATGGFVRLYSGLSNITGSSFSGNLQGQGSDLAGSQGRRETIAYDRFLDLLALWLFNGSIYDARGEIVQQGYIQMTFDGGTYIGWFDTDFTITETAERPYQFQLNAKMIIDTERQTLRSTLVNPVSDQIQPGTGQPLGQQPTFGSAGITPDGEIGIRRGTGVFT